MITFDEAKRIALTKIGSDCALVESATIEKPYGWYFIGQSRAYLETGDIDQMQVGSGGFIVERANGRIFEFGSAYPAKQWIANYERGFKYERYDLIVVSVNNMTKAIELLTRLRMQHVIPELKYGVIWRIPIDFTADRIRDALERLPCKFANQAFWSKVDIFDLIDASGSCVYELREHIVETERDR